MRDIISVTSDVIALIKDQQFEAAKQMVSQAVRLHAEKSVHARSEAINQINIELHRIKMQRDNLRQTVLSLPEKERLFAEVQIEEVVDKIFSDEIAALKARKRGLSHQD